MGGSGALQGGSSGEQTEQAAPEGTPEQQAAPATEAAPAGQAEGSEPPAESPKAE
ncbi:hypothetical protein ACN28S_17125 [Cystobacter fuscus]